MKSKLEGGEYARPEALRRDFELIYRNCAAFNAEGAVIVTVARQIKDLGLQLVRDTCSLRKNKTSSASKAREGPRASS